MVFNVIELLRNAQTMIIINGDDFEYSFNKNLGIYKAFWEGMESSICTLVNFEGGINNVGEIIKVKKLKILCLFLSEKIICSVQ